MWEELGGPLRSESRVSSINQIDENRVRSRRLTEGGETPRQYLRTTVISVSPNHPAARSASELPHGRRNGDRGQPLANEVGEVGNNSRDQKAQLADRFTSLLASVPIS